MTLDEWIAVYEKKTKETFGKNGSLLFNPEKGFMQYSVRDAFRGEKVFLVNATCGDGIFWESFARRAAKLCGCSSVITTTFRDPRAYKRRFKNAEIIGYIFAEKVR
jgi:hypothetical protein